MQEMNSIRLSRPDFRKISNSAIVSAQQMDITCRVVVLRARQIWRNDLCCNGRRRKIL